MPKGPLRGRMALTPMELLSSRFAVFFSISIGFSLGGLAGLPPSALARWASPADAASAFEFWRSFYRVEKDGSYTEETEFKAKILKASAISSFGNYSLTYNEQSETLEILSAKTIHQGKEYPVDLKLIEDKPLASSHGGFDQIRQVLIAFPHVQTGSYVYLRYRCHKKIPPYQNFFSYFMSSNSLFVKKFKVVIESARPLFYKVNNPGRFLKTSYYTKGKGKAGKRYVFHVSLRRPVFKAIVNEKYSLPDPDLFPYVEAATAKKWSEMTGDMAGKYEKIIKEPLPKIYREILKAAKKIKTGEEDQVDLIISSLIEKIRYLRDWRAVSGGYIPRPLAKIAETGFGDCKDMSVSLAAILRRLGFQAHAVLVERGFIRRAKPFHLPNKLAFNHAIVRAEIKGKVFWLDPTNQVTYSRGLFEDVADRPVLILQEPESKMARTPELKSAGAEVYLTQDFYLAKDGSAKVKGEMRFSGRSAAAFAGSSLYKSKKTTDYELIQYTGANTSTLDHWEVKDYDLSSRTVRSFSAKFSYVEQDGGLFNFWTQLGPAFRFPYLANISLFYVRSKDRVSGLFTTHPQRYVFISRLKNIKPAGELFNRSLSLGKLNCRLSSPWADFRREAISKDPLIIKDVYEFKKARITARELKGSVFFRLSNGLNRCFNRFLMVYQK